jgi:hypothetical protein
MICKVGWGTPARKDGLFIWQSKQTANAIRKSDLPDREKNELKQILTDDQVKNNIS